MASRSKSPASNQTVNGVVAAVLSWLVPGLGHVYLGHRARGVIILVAIGLAFWAGVAIGGIKTTVQPTERQAWFAAQVCTGVHAMAVVALSKRLEDKPPYEYSRYVAYYPVDDIAVVYTGVAGLLNVLVILDVLARGPKVVEAAAARTTRPERGSA